MGFVLSTTEKVVTNILMGHYTPDTKLYSDEAYNKLYKLIMGFSDSVNWKRTTKNLISLKYLLSDVTEDDYTPFPIGSDEGISFDEEIERISTNIVKRMETDDESGSLFRNALDSLDNISDIARKDEELAMCYAVMLSIALKRRTNLRVVKNRDALAPGIMAKTSRLVIVKK